MTSRIREIESFDSRRVNLAQIKSDRATQDWQDQLKSSAANSLLPFFLLPIDSLTVTKTIGRGRTNVTLVVPTVVQTDAATPSAGFDRRATPSRNPVVQIHFEPSAYGISSVSTFVVDFTIQVAGQGTFDLNGFAGAGTVVNGGSKVLSGATTVSLILRNVPPRQQTFAFLEQTAGARWNWLSSRISFPPLVLSQ
jgi:hypothetical protein